MEPVTYFVTYDTTMAMYGYYVLTRQEYNFADVRNREYLLTMHRHAKNKAFNIEKYNKLRDTVSQTEYDLERLREPLELHLPLQHILHKAGQTLPLKQ